VSLIGLAGGAGLAVIAAVVLYAFAARRARSIEASASQERLHDLRVASVRINGAALVGGVYAAGLCIVPTHWERIGSGPLIITVLAAVAYLMLPSAVARRPVVAAYARLRDIPAEALRSYRGTAASAIGIALMLWPIVTALAIDASLAVKAIFLAAAYLVVNRLLGGLLTAPALARILGPGSPPADLQAAISRLAMQAGVRVRVRVAPAGARREASAVQIGWVPGLRYVLITDYLLDELAPSDTGAVLAHELGHARHHDVLVSQVIGSFWLIPATIAAVSAVAHARFLAVILAFIAFAIIVGFGQLQRTLKIRQELAADELAAGIVGPAALMSALARLTELNEIKRETSLAWDERVGHPGTARRIGRLEEKASAARTPDL
jgi:STE24 endopeptidase